MDEGAGASFGMVWDPFEQDNWNRENYTAESVVRTKKWGGVNIQFEIKDIIKVVSPFIQGSR